MKLKDFDFRIWDNSTNKFIEFAISDNIRAIPKKNDDLVLELWSGYFDKNGKKFMRGTLSNMFMCLTIPSWIKV